jgi:formylglycine-generating enzyme required for sulfatase activity
LLSLGEFANHQLPAAEQQRLVEQLGQTYRQDPDPGIHSAVDWLLRCRWGQGEQLRKIDQDLAGQMPGLRQWYMTAHQEHTLAVIRNPAMFTMGSPEHEPDRRPEETPHSRHIPRSFAIATKEVTVRQFQQFLKEKPGIASRWGRSLEKCSPEEPIVGVTWFEAVQYCRWLGEKESISEGQQCYSALADIKPGMQLPADYLVRTGYRLPAEAEWEYTCRAGAITSRPYGDGDKLLAHYAWHIDNSRGRAGRVGSLKPNDFGLFDMLGNAWEWCHDARAPYPPGPYEDREQPGAVTAAQERVLRGGGFFSGASELRSAHRFGLYPQMSFSLAGFRVARTVP